MDDTKETFLMLLPEDEVVSAGARPVVAWERVGKCATCNATSERPKVELNQAPLVLSLEDRVSVIFKIFWYLPEMW